MIGSPKPTSYESLMSSLVNPLSSTHPIPSTRPRDVSDEPSLWRCCPTHSRACEVEPLAEVHVPHAAATRWRWLAWMRSCRALVPRSGLTAPSPFRRASCCISWLNHCSDDCFKDPLIACYWATRLEVQRRRRGSRFRHRGGVVGVRGVS